MEPSILDILASRALRDMKNIQHRKMFNQVQLWNHEKPAHLQPQSSRRNRRKLETWKRRNVEL